MWLQLLLATVVKTIKAQTRSVGYPFAIKRDDDGPEYDVDEFQQEKWNADAEEIALKTITMFETTGEGLDEGRYPRRNPVFCRPQVATGSQGNYKKDEMQNPIRALDDGVRFPCLRRIKLTLPRKQTHKLHISISVSCCRPWCNLIEYNVVLDI